MIVSLFVYLALDLNAKIILSNDLLTGDPVRVWSILKRALPTITKFISIRGLIVILYVALIAPLLGFGLSLSVTERLYIPTFIASVIADTPLYLAAVTLLCLLFISIGIANLFILHGVVLDGLSLKEAGKQSGKLIRANWKDYLIQNVLFILIMAFFSPGCARGFPGASPDTGRIFASVRRAQTDLDCFLYRIGPFSVICGQPVCKPALPHENDSALPLLQAG